MEAATLPQHSNPTLVANSDSLWRLAALFFLIPFLWEYLFTKTSFQFVDLPSFYFAAKAVFLDERSPFDYSVLSSYEVQAGQHIFPFFYNPASLIFVSPLLLFSYPSAGIIVLVLNHLAAIACAYLSLRRLFHLRAPHTLLLGLALILSQPLAINQLSGQVNLGVLLCLLLFIINERDGRSGWQAALPLSIAIIVKTYPIVFCAMLLVRGKWSTLFWTAGMTVGIMIGSLALIPEIVWKDWATMILPFTGYGVVPPNLFSPASPYNQSLNGFFIRSSNLFLTYTTTLTWIACGCAALITCGVSATTRNVPLPFAFVSFTLLTLMIAPLTWEHHLVFALPAIGLFLSRSENRRDTLTVLMMLSLFLISWKIPFDHPFLMTGGRRTFIISVKLYAIIALWIGSLIAQLRYNRELRE